MLVYRAVYFTKLFHLSKFDFFTLLSAERPHFSHCFVCQFAVVGVSKHFLFRQMFVKSDYSFNSFFKL